MKDATATRSTKQHVKPNRAGNVKGEAATADTLGLEPLRRWNLGSEVVGALADRALTGPERPRLAPYRWAVSLAQ